MDKTRLELKNLIKLSSKVGIYIPSTIDVSKEAGQISVNEHIDKTLSLLSAWFGGATATDAIGCWKSISDGLVKEKVKICYAYCSSEQLNNNIENIINYCLELKGYMGQEAISLEVNNELYFI